MEELIKKVLEENGPMKGPELITKVVKMASEKDLPDEDIPNLLERLVVNGSIMEVEYVLPSSTSRTRSIYFPGGSDISVRRP